MVQGVAGCGGIGERGDEVGRCDASRGLVVRVWEVCGLSAAWRGGEGWMKVGIGVLLVLVLLLAEKGFWAETRGGFDEEPEFRFVFESLVCDPRAAVHASSTGGRVGRRAWGCEG